MTLMHTLPNFATYMIVLLYPNGNKKDTVALLDIHFDNK